MTGIPRWVMLLLAAALVAFGIATSQGWIRDPALAKADYLGTTGVSVEEAKLYRAVPFEWRVTSAAGSFKGNDTAHIRVNSSGRAHDSLRLGPPRQRRRLDPRHALAERGAPGDRRHQGDGAVHRAGRKDTGRRAERRLPADRWRREAAAGCIAGARRPAGAGVEEIRNDGVANSDSYAKSLLRK